MNRPRITILFACAIALSALRPPGVRGADAGGGDVLCVQGQRTDAVILAGTARSGIYRSADGGGTWMQTGLREGRANAIAADPRNASHFYAGTSLGLCASTDTGRTWWPIDPQMQARALAVSWSAPRVVLASDGAVVRRTADDGRSWDVIEPLRPYAIALLASVRSDSGSVFAAACDTAILISVEKNQAAWTRLPALPRGDANAPRITALVMDTLSTGGMELVAGTTSGVFVYSITSITSFTSFPQGAWRRLANGIPDARIGALGLIAYDTTLSSRAYSLCASVAGDSAGAGESGVYKISSIGGVLDASASWKKIAGETIDVRACFMPDRGANRAKIYLATSDGLRISYDGGTTWMRAPLAASPIAVPVALSYQAGVVANGGTSRIALRVVNRGEAILTLHARMEGDAESFTLPAADEVLIAAAGDTCAIPIEFHPEGPGKFSARIVVETNDPLLPSFTVTTAGFCTGQSAQRRTVVIDRGHGGAAWPSYAALAGALTTAGMSVIDSVTETPSGAKCAMIVLPAPARSFTDAECGIIARAAAAGASVIALCGADEASRRVLNTLFASDAWRGEDGSGTGFPLRFGTARMTAPAGAFDAAKSPALRSAAWLAGLDAFRFASAQEVVSAGGDTLFTAKGVTRTDTTDVRTDAAAMVAGVARTGKGKVIVIGDAGFWASDTAVGETGLWAADNFAAALSIAGTIENGDAGLDTKTANEEYALISIPYPPADNSVGSVLGSLGEPDPMKWRLFGAWNERSQTYAEYPSPTMMTIDRGRGYWLVTRGAREITSSAADYSLIPEPFAIRLEPGFTLVGDPFVFAVDWERAARPAGVEPILWSYNGKEFLASAVMEPFKGYFVYNAADSAAVVRVLPAVGATGAQKIVRNAAGAMAGASACQADGEWSLHVSATDGTVNDGGNFCGMLRASADGRDAHDFAEPPLSPGRSVSFRFMQDGAALAGDYKTVHEDGAWWDCDVRTSEPGARVTVRLAAETSLPEGYRIWLLDRAEERVTDCTDGGSAEIRFAPNERVRALRLIAGRQMYIEQHTDGVPLTPLAYALEQNFPNPWNPSTTIGFTLAHSGEVRLEIFDLLGQKVRTLARGAFPLGTFRQEWDGRDDKGAPAASGVYIYRLTTPAYAQSRRMVLLR